MIINADTQEVQDAVNTLALQMNNKQDTLKVGKGIKCVDGKSLIGGGNITIDQHYTIVDTLPEIAEVGDMVYLKTDGKRYVCTNPGRTQKNAYFKIDLSAYSSATDMPVNYAYLAEYYDPRFTGTSAQLISYIPDPSIYFASFGRLNFNQDNKYSAGIYYSGATYTITVKAKNNVFTLDSNCPAVTVRLLDDAPRFGVEYNSYMAASEVKWEEIGELKVVSLTQAEYDALTEYGTNTLYNITDAE